VLTDCNQSFSLFSSVKYGHTYSEYGQAYSVRSADDDGHSMISRGSKRKFPQDLKCTITRGSAAGSDAGDIPRGGDDTHSIISKGGGKRQRQLPGGDTHLYFKDTGDADNQSAVSKASTKRRMKGKGSHVDFKEGVYAGGKGDLQPKHEISTYIGRGKGDSDVQSAKTDKTKIETHVT